MGPRRDRRVHPYRNGREDNHFRRCLRMLQEFLRILNENIPIAFFVLSLVTGLVKSCKEIIEERISKGEIVEESHLEVLMTQETSLNELFNAYINLNNLYRRLYRDTVSSFESLYSVIEDIFDFRRRTDEFHEAALQTLFQLQDLLEEMVLHYAGE